MATKELWYFYADWCTYCKQMTPILEEYLDKNPKVEVIRLNADNDQDAIDAAGVDSFPQILPIIRGQVREPIKGLVSMEELERAMK
jgi:thioredoxin 1